MSSTLIIPHPASSPPPPLQIYPMMQQVSSQWRLKPPQLNPSTKAIIPSKFINTFSLLDDKICVASGNRNTKNLFLINATTKDSFEISSAIKSSNVITSMSTNSNLLLTGCQNSTLQLYQLSSTTNTLNSILQISSSSNAPGVPSNVPGKLYQSSAIDSVLLISDQLFATCHSSVFRLYDTNSVGLSLASIKLSGKLSKSFLNPNLLSISSNILDLRLLDSLTPVLSLSNSVPSTEYLAFHPFVEHWFAVGSKSGGLSVYDMRYLNSPCYSNTSIEAASFQWSNVHSHVYSCSSSYSTVIADLYGDVYFTGESSVSIANSNAGWYYCTSLGELFHVPCASKDYTEKFEGTEYECLVYERKINEAYEFLLDFANENEWAYSDGLDMVQLLTPTSNSTNQTFSFNKQLINEVYKSVDDAIEVYDSQVEIVNKESGKEMFYNELDVISRKLTGQYPTRPELQNQLDIYKSKLSILGSLKDSTSVATSTIETLLNNLKENVNSYSSTMLRKLVEFEMEMSYLNGLELGRKILECFPMNSNCSNLVHILLYPTVYDSHEVEAVSNIPTPSVLQRSNSGRSMRSSGSKWKKNVKKFGVIKSSTRESMDSVMDDVGVLLDDLEIQRKSALDSTLKNLKLCMPMIQLECRIQTLLNKYKQSDKESLKTVSMQIYDLMKHEKTISVSSNRAYLNCLLLLGKFDEYFMKVEELIETFGDDMYAKGLQVHMEGAGILRIRKYVDDFMYRKLEVSGDNISNQDQVLEILEKLSSCLSIAKKWKKIETNLGKIFNGLADKLLTILLSSLSRNATFMETITDSLGKSQVEEVRLFCNKLKERKRLG